MARHSSQRIHIDPALIRLASSRDDQAPLHFDRALIKWMGDTPIGVEKPFGSIVLGPQFHFTILDADHKIGAQAGEPLELGCREIEPDIFPLGIVDDHADKALRTDGRLHQPAADPDLVGGLGDGDFVHGGSPVDSEGNLATSASPSPGKCPPQQSEAA